MALLESPHLVETRPHNLLVDQQIVVSLEKTVQVLPVLAFQKEHFQHDFLLQSTANIADYAGFQRIFYRVAVCELPIGKPVSKLDDLVNQGQERVQKHVSQVHSDQV